MAIYRHTVSLTYPNGGGPGVNVWHLRTTGEAPSSAGELEGLSEIIRAWYDAVFDFMQPGCVIAYNGVAVTVEAEPQFDSSAPAWSMTAPALSDTAPPVLAICVNWLTTNASRSGRGRTFLGPLSRQAIDSNGTISAAALTDIRAANSALVAASEGFTNGAIGVYSPTDGLLRDVVSSAVRDQFAILTSRRD